MAVMALTTPAHAIDISRANLTKYYHDSIGTVEHYLHCVKKTPEVNDTIEEENT